ncbi:hypothetical protein TYRP_001180 [Tyrophagus putrescentiae]|nr:hypothetical protein TYRP_001180 [Tyrophagus putrescentiae]
MTQDTQQFSREEDMEEKSHLDLLDMTQPATVNSGGSDKENKSNSQLQSQQDAINRSAREFEEAKMQAKALKIKFDKYKQIPTRGSENSECGPILSDINLSVQQGEIFGLLGSGKTTLVRLILGRLFPSSGIISLLGNRVDGPRNPPRPSDIGYMPQDLVLYQQFTPVEMLRYFGQLYKLSGGEIEKRIDFVLRLLSLKQFLQVESKLTQEYTMQITQLSGGQKRRISLAIALLHRPRFLILDEPTVGCDPLLRETIWMHLKQLTTATMVTVFLTTHYIEEARDAQSIGFLRNGRLLVQDSPQSLLDRFATTSMEKVFLQLCRKANAEQNHHHGDQDRLSPTDAKEGFSFDGTVKVENMLEGVNLKNKLELLPPLDIRTSSQILSPLSLLTANKKKVSPNGNKPTDESSLPKKRSSVASKFSSCFTFNHVLRHSEDPFTYTGTPAREHFICWAHLLTLMGKNFRQLRRNSSLLIFFILLPAIEIALIMLCIGREIENIPIAVFNGETTPDLSLIFLQSIPDGAFLQQNYATPEAALEAVSDSRAHALLQFSPNFSHALRARFFSFAFDEAEAISGNNNNGTDNNGSSSLNGTSIYDESSVFVRLDMSNQLIGLQVQRQLLKAFLNFAQRLASNLGLSNQTFKPPLNFGEPVYGIQGGASAVVETFIAPGALIMIAFFATTIVTCHLLIHEVRQALIERALIAGRQLGGVSLLAHRHPELHSDDPADADAADRLQALSPCPTSALWSFPCRW